MSSKENAAINQLFERLECRYALRVLWALKDGHPQTFRLLQDSVGGITPNTLNTRIKELREAGFVDHGSDGYTVGGGLEYLFTQNWSGKIEYQYYDFGNVNVFSPAGAFLGQVRNDEHTIKAGINYRFGWGGAPVVAKY